MEYFAYCNEDGVVLWTGSGPAGAAAVQQPSEGHSIELIDSHVQKNWVKQGDTFVPPSEPVLTIEERRLSRRREAQAYREQVIAGGCMAPCGKRVQTDKDSQDNIMQAFARAQIALARGEPYEINFQMEDNTRELHDAEQMMGMALAVGAFKTACYNASFDILDAIAISENPEAIDITEGYPSS